MEKKVLERTVKAKVAEIFKKEGIWYFMPAMNGMGRAGIPDFIACVDGMFLGVETKAGKNKPTDHQVIELEAIQAAGGFSVVVNENSVGMLVDLIASIRMVRKVPRG